MRAIASHCESDCCLAADLRKQAQKLRAKVRVAASAGLSPGLNAYRAAEAGRLDVVASRLEDNK